MWCANTNTVAQRTKYYPSGLPFAYDRTLDHPDLQHRKYNGKEFVEMHGYDTYDIVWRQYYPAIARFQTPDPYAEKYYSISPYAMCGDNMVNRIDPDGRQLFTPLFGFSDILMSQKPVVTETMSKVARTTTEASSKTAEATSKTAATTSKTTEAISKTTSENKSFGGKQSTESKTSNESFGKAKDANGIPRSQQPEKTIKPNTPEGKEAGLDNRNIKQWEFKNSKGERIIIRQDKAAQYGEQSGKGNQSEHFNAGKSNENLSKQHHYYLW